jgi:hypothetical protein
MICEGKVQHTTGDWYDIVFDDCSFDGNSSSGKAVLNTCGIGNPCRVKAYGEWEHHHFYIKQVISARRIDQDALTEIPEQYRGTWVLQYDNKTPPNSADENRMGSVQSFSHIWFGLSGARHWLKR